MPAPGLSLSARPYRPVSLDQKAMPAPGPGPAALLCTLAGGGRSRARVRSWARLAQYHWVAPPRLDRSIEARQCHRAGEARRCYWAARGRGLAALNPKP